MRILFVNTLYAPYIGGGAEITLQNLVESLQRVGADVAIASLHPSSEKIIDHVNGVKVWRFPCRNLYLPYKNRPAVIKRYLWQCIDSYNPATSADLHEVVAHFKPDVVSLHNMAGWSIAITKLLASIRIPFVNVLHDNYLLCAKSSMSRGTEPCLSQCSHCALLRKPHRSLSNSSAGVVGVSEHILRKFLRNGFFENASIKTHIWNTRPKNKTHKPVLRDGDLVFGYIGSIIPPKGVDLLLSTFLEYWRPGWKLFVAGANDSTYAKSLSSKYKHTGITWLGQTDATSFFNSISVTIVPSLWEEPLGMVVAESHLSGRPVIASSRGGIPEIVDGNLNGILFDPSSTSQLGTAMCEFSDSREVWAQRSDAIRLQAETMFSDQTTWALRWLDIYTNSSSAEAKK